MASPAGFARLRRNLEEYDALKQELKRRAMIFQYDAKVCVARHFNLTFAQVDLPYAEWSALRTKYREETGHDP